MGNDEEKNRGVTFNASIAENKLTLTTLPSNGKSLDLVFTYVFIIGHILVLNLQILSSVFFVAFMLVSLDQTILWTVLPTTALHYCNSVQSHVTQALV